MAGKYKFDWNKTKKDLKKEAEKSSNSYEDKRFWKLTRDDNQKGSAIIRFLPDKQGTPYRKYFTHFFWYDSGSGQKVYSAPCRTSLGVDYPCPVCDKNRELWRSAYEVDKDVARNRKRSAHFVSNILVIKDPVKPENEGKVFLFDYGSQIHDKFALKLFGPEEDDGLEEKIVTYAPCCFDEGADFIFRSTLKKDTKTKKNAKGYPTYEFSKFKDQTKLFDHLDNEDERDVAIEKIMSKTHSLIEWTKEETYPTEASTKSKLACILGVSKNIEVVEDIEEDEILEEELEVLDAGPVEKETTKDSISDEDFIDDLLDD